MPIQAREAFEGYAPVNHEPASVQILFSCAPIKSQCQSQMRVRDAMQKSLMLLELHPSIVQK